MRMLVACDAFKGALTAHEACAAVAAGLGAAWPGCDIDLMPVADGGEGSLGVLEAVFARREVLGVMDACGAPLRADVGLAPGEVLVESAQAVGWQVPGAQPWRFGSAGVGVMVAQAVDLLGGQGVVHLALGGSRTVDGGLGFLQALGARALDCAGRDVAPGLTGLLSLAALDVAPAWQRLGGVSLRVWCDVQSPLLGAGGAALYMAQKGLDDVGVRAATAALERFAALAEAKSGVSVGERPGGGAAGGLGAAALLLDGALVSGADEVLRRVDAEERVRRATWVWGGEGRVDGQSGAGKAMMALARLCRRQARPLVLFCGEDAGGEALLAEGVCAVFPIGPGPRSLDVALSATRGDLQRCATQVLRVLKWGCGGASIESCNGGS